MSIAADAFSFFARSASNNKVNWEYSVMNSMELAGYNPAAPSATGPTTWGKSFINKNNIYFETVLEDVNSISNISIGAWAHYPVDLVNGNPSVQGYLFNAVKFFSEIKPNSGETYNGFKTRVLSNKLQYGFYKQNGETKVIINIGSSNNNVKYSQIGANFATTVANNAISQGWYEETSRADLINYINKMYGNDNVVSGNAVTWTINFDANYSKVVQNVTKTATTTYFANGATLNGPNTKQATLEGVAGSAKIEKYTARVYISSDSDSKAIKNAIVKLQKKNSEGVWEDYKEEIKTNDNGYAEYIKLNDGTYRFVQTKTLNKYLLKGSKGYDESLAAIVSEEFMMKSSDVEGHKVFITNIQNPDWNVNNSVGICIKNCDYDDDDICDYNCFCDEIKCYEYCVENCPNSNDNDNNNNEIENPNTGGFVSISVITISIVLLSFMVVFAKQKIHKI